MGRPMIEFVCPSRQWSAMSGIDHWREGNTCSYCGSANPEAVMQWLEDQAISLTPTDKNYKVYLNARVPGLKVPLKFYFQHFSVMQKERFVALYNDRHLKLEYPGHFYVFPFFMTPVPNYPQEVGG